MPPKKTVTKRAASKKAASQHPGNQLAQVTSSTKGVRERAFQETFYSDTTSSSDEDADPAKRFTKRGHLKHRRKHRPKRPKTTSANAPEVSDHEFNNAATDIPGEQPLASRDLTVKLFQGSNGPELRLKLGDIFADGVVPLRGLGFVQEVEPSTDKIRSPEEMESTPKFATFTDLPSELSLRIYRQLFVTKDEPIVFTCRKGFQRSSQFLRTCRKVHAEGTLILYGENAFHFSRAHHVRGEYYEASWKEVGYKDVRRFFYAIGKHNLAKLRYVSIEFDDALPTMTPNATCEDRKYVNDVFLIDIINMLAEHTLLEKFGIGLNGRSTFGVKDYHLLRAVCMMRCHEFICDRSHGAAKAEAAAISKVRNLIVVPKIFGGNNNSGGNKFVPRFFMSTLLPYPSALPQN